MTLFFTAVVAGLGVGAVYALIALSYSVIYSSSGIFNVAQGELMVFGILTAYFVIDRWHWPIIASLPLIILVVVVLSLVEERVAVRPFIGKAGIGWFISTLAVTQILTTLAANIYGSRPIETIPSLFGENSIFLGSVAIAPKFLTAFVILIVITVALELFYARSWLGTAMRGVAEDHQVASLRGISVARISQLAFVLAAIVTGVAAFVIAPIVSADVSVGLNYTFKGFIALAIGGFGSIRGAVIGGLLLGMSEQMFDLYVSSTFEIAAALILIFAVLLIRPTGLFGVRGARDV